MVEMNVTEKLCVATTLSVMFYYFLNKNVLKQIYVYTQTHTHFKETIGPL